MERLVFLFLLAMSSLLLSACDSRNEEQGDSGADASEADAADDADSGLASPCLDNGVAVTIVENHPRGYHALDVPVEDVLAGVEITYDIQGNNTGHGHTLTVTPDDFAAIDGGEVVTLTSSDTGAQGQDHTHDVILSCLADAASAAR